MLLNLEIITVINKYFLVLLNSPKYFLMDRVPVSPIIIIIAHDPGWF